MGQKPLNEGRQMASKINIVKIGQYTVFPRGVDGFFQVKENGKNFFFFFFFWGGGGGGKSITNELSNRTSWSAVLRFFRKPRCSEASKPLDSKTHINCLFTILSIVLHKQLVKAMGL